MIRKPIQIKLARVKIGGGAPVSIQSMTNTDTKDIKKTISQIKSLEKVGCEIIWVAVKDAESAKAISKIKKTVDALEGSISGFGSNIIIATPEFAEIYKSKKPEIPDKI